MRPHSVHSQFITFSLSVITPSSHFFTISWFLDFCIFMHLLISFVYVQLALLNGVKVGSNLFYVCPRLTSWGNFYFLGMHVCVFFHNLQIKWLEQMTFNLV